MHSDLTILDLAVSLLVRTRPDTLFPRWFSNVSFAVNDVRTRGFDGRDLAGFRFYDDRFSLVSSQNVAPRNVLGGLVMPKGFLLNPIKLL